MYKLQDTPYEVAQLDNGVVVDPLATLKDEYGGVAHIIEDDHCFVLIQKTEEQKGTGDPRPTGAKYSKTTHWFPEAVKAVQQMEPPTYATGSEQPTNTTGEEGKGYPQKIKPEGQWLSERIAELRDHVDNLEGRGEPIPQHIDDQLQALEGRREQIKDQSEYEKNTPSRGRINSLKPGRLVFYVQPSITVGFTNKILAEAFTELFMAKEEQVGQKARDVAISEERHGDWRDCDGKPLIGDGRENAYYVQRHGLKIWYKHQSPQDQQDDEQHSPVETKKETGEG